MKKRIKNNNSAILTVKHHLDFIEILLKECENNLINQLKPKIKNLIDHPTFNINVIDLIYLFAKELESSSHQIYYRSTAIQKLMNEIK